MTLCLKKNPSTLVYMSRTHSESLVRRPQVFYILCATSSHEQTGDIIICVQFEEGDSVVNEFNLEED